MAEGDFKFNLQQYLAEMREEQRSDISALADKVDNLSLQLHGRISAVQTKVVDHETRIVVVENTRRSILWLGGAIVVGFIGGLYDLLFVHLPNHFKP